MMTDIFISYSRQRPDPTVQLAEDLIVRGYDVTFDVDLLPNDTQFEAVINDWIDSSRAVITIWSPPALKSRWVPYEASRARGQNKLLNVGTDDFEPEKLPADFHGSHVSLVSDAAAVFSALVEMNVRPVGQSETDLPPRDVLKRHAQKIWVGRVRDSDDEEEVRAFLAEYERLAFYRTLAEKKLAGLKARIIPSSAVLVKPSDLKGNEIAVAFDLIKDSDDLEDLDDFLKEFGAFDTFIVRQALKRRDRMAEALGEPDATPDLDGVIEDGSVFLRLNPDMHTAQIVRIGATADGGLLATASHDKTVKLWSLPDGELVRTFRPPIGTGDEGKLYSVALDPKGQWLATGGYTTDEVGLTEYIYVFDVRTGRLERRVGPFPAVVFDLSVSPDGSRLAAGFGNEAGVAVIDTETWIELWHDTEYGEGVYGLAFDPSNRLAAGCWDGDLRLYAATSDGIPEKTVTLSGGERLFGVAFSSDGGHLAVGFDDSTIIDILNGQTLAYERSISIPREEEEELGSIAFLNGNRIAAGGSADDYQISVFDLSSGDERLVYERVENTVLDLAALPNDAFAYSSADPAFGVIGETSSLHRGPETADMWCQPREAHFTVSRDGRHLRFGINLAADLVVEFDMETRRLWASPDPVDGFTAAEIEGLPVGSWENSTVPSFDGHLLPFEAHETSRSLAIAPDRKRFFLGTEWYVRCFDVLESGVFRKTSTADAAWEISVPSVAWGVNLARDGRLLVVAYGDGTIRWHRASDGEELLALFLHLPQGRDDTPIEEIEWVLFTPEGYYDASPKGEALIGWHVNRGEDREADFYPVETFREAFKRPDVVNSALDDI